MQNKEVFTIDTYSLARKMERYVVSVRRHLHKYPEISMQEERTIAFVTNELTKLNVPFEIVKEGGIIATIGGKQKGKTLILRADLDALPMQEEKTNLLSKKEVVSSIDGAAHTCGHDAHTAMLLGVAHLLKDIEETLPGKVLLVFEQGEEIGGGIRALLERLVEIGADGIWGIHVKNDLQSGKISIEKGPRMSAPMPFHVQIKGKGGHGSRPDLSHSPIDCFVDLHQKLTMMRLQQLDPQKPLTFSVGKLHAGSAKNVIPETLEFGGTFRYLHIEQGRKAEILFKQIVESTCKAHHCTYHYLIEPVAKDLGVTNDEQCTEIAINAAKKSIGPNALTSFPAWMASEPFALYQAFFPGVFAFLGIQNEEKGTGADHHNVHFDVDEDVMKLGVATTLQFALDFLYDEKPLDFHPKVKSVSELFD